VWSKTLLGNEMSVSRALRASRTETLNGASTKDDVSDIIFTLFY